MAIFSVSYHHTICLYTYVNNIVLIYIYILILEQEEKMGVRELMKGKWVI
jgi:hypothetical protein